MIEVEGVGSEVVWMLCVLLLLGVLVLAWLSTGLAPLDYDLFLVEMQTWRTRRIVQVLHVGYSEVRGASMDMVRRLRARARRTAEDREFRERAAGREVDGPPLVHSDTNVVIQSPATVVEPQALTRNMELTHRVSSSEGARLWEVEIPSGEAAHLQPTDDGSIPSVAAANESEIAAAAAIAVVNGRRRITTRLGDTHTEMVVARVTPVSFDLDGEPPVHVETRRAYPTRVVNPVRPVQPGAAPFVPDENEDDEEEPSAAPPPTPESNPPTIVSTPVAPSKPASMAEVVRLEQATGDTEIKLKFLDDTQRMVPVWLDSTVGEFKRTVFGDALSGGQVIRLIFKGQLLRDDARKLEDYGLHAGCVVHCHVSSTPYNQPRTGASAAVPMRRTATAPSTVAAGEAVETPGTLPVDAEMMRRNAIPGAEVQFPDGNIGEQMLAVTVALVRAGTRALLGLDGGIELARGLEGMVQGEAATAREEQAQPQAQQPQLQQPQARSWSSRALRWINDRISVWNDERPPADGRSFLEEAADRAAAPPPREPWQIGNWMTLIFALQVCAMWVFVILFPQVVDKTAVAILAILSAVFFYHWRRQISAEPAVPERPEQAQAQAQEAL